MSRELAVLSNTQLIGHLRERGDLWEFEYAPEWMSSPESFDLSPVMPRGTSLHRDGATDRPVQWYFDNLLPEEGLRTLIAKEANLPSEDAFGLLAHFGSESAGSLVLLAATEAVPVASGLKPLPLAELSRRIRNLPTASLTRNAPKKMSLAGAQHKMLVVVQSGNLFEPLPGTPSTHILKPNHQDTDYPSSVINEYFTMRLAKTVGLDVPGVLRRYVPEPVYLVERFDRTGVRTDEIRRRHVIDTCQLLNKSRSFKYTAARLDTLQQAIARCRMPMAARLQLYRWLVFNILVGNGDNHIKNISFIVAAAGITLAPAYDLLSTAVYETRALANEKARWPHSELALSIGDVKHFADISRADLIAAGVFLGLAEATTIRELDRLIKRLPIAAEKLIDHIAAENEGLLQKSPDPQATLVHIEGEMRLLRAISKIVMAEMVERLGKRQPNTQGSPS